MPPSTIWFSRTDTQRSYCRACGKDEVRHVLDLSIHDKDYAYLRCLGCDSLMPAEPVHDVELGGYQPGKLEKDLGLKHYLEIGAGIASLYEPLQAVAPKPRGSLLDVGCGFGFLVDLWNSQPGCRAEGIELASYGHWGRELLGVQISHSKLNVAKDCASSLHDFVFAGEVIEHVADPATFLRELRSKLAPEGILCLTTPDAAAISPNMPMSNLLASLSPGAHQILFADNALRKLLFETGFPHIVTRQQGGRLVAWASRKPLNVGGLRHVSNDPIVIAYLERLSKHSHPWLRGGALYRLFREAVNRGSYAAALEYAASIDQMHLSTTGEPDWIEHVLKGTLKTDTQDQLIEGAPCYAGPYLFYRGMLALNASGNYASALRRFTAAARICTHWTKVAPTVSTEHASLIATTLFHARLALQHCGREIEAYENALQAGETGESRWYTPVSRMGNRMKLTVKRIYKSSRR